MKLNSLLPISCVLCFCSLQAIPPGYAQTQTASGADKITAMLLRPAGWKANWIRGDDKGVSEIVFETREGKIVAKIRNLTNPATCEHDVTIVADVVKFDGCYDYDIALRFDTGDKKYPFKGKSGKGFDYTVQAK